ncbi:MAG: 3-isopropylmalate dehydratase small subunit [Gammaproteobacteria bacterium]|nr:3-isopropylmalate dehydratase small subunit [Gammaproteobacteria bacterium]
MEPFTRMEAVAAPLDIRNLDTNQLCPTRFNKLPIHDPDYHKVLFNNQRFDQSGEPVGEFILNRAPYDKARILVADENFGCGSSRESAVYALLAFGVRSVIAPSFGDIFYNNCTKNGLLPVRLVTDVCDALRRSLHLTPGALVTVDLEHQRVLGPDSMEATFDIHAGVRDALLAGLDDVGLTRQSAAEIDAFEARYRQQVPWLFGERDL